MPISRSDAIKAILAQTVDQHKDWLDRQHGLSSITLTVRVTKHGLAYECDFRPIVISR